jgi:formylglycine-generating enzyme required for sulfatase activity/serine/threonine protein kinase
VDEATLLRAIKDFLLDLIGKTTRERQDFITDALQGCKAENGIVYDGTPIDFTSQLVIGLHRYGVCDRGDFAVVMLLRAILKRYGSDKAERGNALIAAYEGLFGTGQRESSPKSTLQAGDLVCGCTLVRRLGKGGNGEVWLADQPINATTVRPVAIKLLLAKWRQDDTRLTRFREEPAAQMQLERNPHVTPIYLTCEHDGLPAIVSRYVAGGALDSYTRGKAFALDTVIGWLAQVAAALDAAHTLPKPLIHRDVKPENILVELGTDGLPSHLYLTDFGLAFSDNDDSPRMTADGDKVGTSGYLAPEQFLTRVREEHGITPQTDIYALAIMAYELLTGDLPFTGEKHQVLTKHETLPLPEHPALSPALLSVLRQGAAKAPDQRPSSASAFVRALRAVWEGKAPEVVAHYLNVTLKAHIESTGSVKDIGVLQAAYGERTAQVRQQSTPHVMPVDPNDPLSNPVLAADDEFALDFSFDDDPADPPPMALEGKVYRPHGSDGYTEPTTTTNIRERLRDLKRVVLLGEPGAGKTFTLARLALDYRDAYPQTAIVPLFVPLSKYDSDEPFEAFADRWLAGLAYREHSVIWLLDALNEMSDAHGQSKRLMTFIRGLVAADVPFVLTCRVRNYEESLRDVPDLHRVDLQDLNPQQIFDILAHYIGTDYAESVWAGVMYGLRGQTDLRQAWEAWTGGVDAFWERPTSTYFQDEQGEYDAVKSSHLRARDHIHTDPRKLMLLCRSPFTLVRLLIPGIRAAAEHARARGVDVIPLLAKVLPNNRAKLFEQVIDRTLNAEKTRKAWSDGHIAAIKGALERAAAALQATEQRTEMAIPAADRALLTDARDAGLLTLTDTTLRFNHQLYQEYFATKRLRDLLDDYDRRHPNWEAGEPLPLRDERLEEIFPDWWEPAGWAVTVTLLGELVGREGIAKVVRWLASYAPEITLNHLILANNDGLKLDDLSPQAKQALIDSANARTTEPDPRGRAAAYRVLGHPAIDADHRPGIGVIRISPVGAWRAMPLQNRGEGLYLPDFDWVTIPAGEFIYQQETEPRPLHAFKISRTPVTYRQFQAFIDDDEGFGNPKWWEGLAMPDGHNSAPDEQWFKYWNHPRENVSWYDAMAFCRWMSWRQGGEYALDKVDEWAVRLPTEFEWERAARFTDGREYPWGDGYTSGYANTDETYGDAGSHYLQMTSAVGIYPEGASPEGILDLSGNVWEWCLTDYNNPAPDASSENTRTTNSRVLRGGSWGGSGGAARAVGRYYFGLPYARSLDRGFRVVVCRPS